MMRQPPRWRIIFLLVFLFFLFRSNTSYRHTLPLWHRIGNKPLRLQLMTAYFLP
jgi:hypothetical protein